MKLFGILMAGVCALSTMARADEVQIAAVMPKDMKIEHHSEKKVEKAKPAAVKVKAQKKQRALTPYEWQLENPQLG